MKKNKLLPETDLARVALLPDSQKYAELMKFRLDAKPRLSYSPFRLAASGIVNARKSLLDLPSQNWKQIEAAIKRACKSRPDWLEGNLCLAQALYNFTQEAPREAFEKEFMPVSIGFGSKIRYWQDFYFNQNGVPAICFMDPRRSRGLNSEGRRFVFSVMQHNVALGDFSEAQFEIYRFPIVDSEESKRRVKMYTFDKSDLLSEADINKAINDTYKIWFKILEEREEEQKRTASGGSSGGWF